MSLIKLRRLVFSISFPRFVRPIGLVWLIEHLADLGDLADSVYLSQSGSLGILSGSAGWFYLVGRFCYLADWR